MTSLFLDVPCLHRIHSGIPKGAHKIHTSIGMSIELDDLLSRLEQLNSIAEKQNLDKKSVFVTFDDGWIDSLLLREKLHNLQYLQPVLFLTLNQLKGCKKMLPLPRLYAWCKNQSIDINQIESIGLSRMEMKCIPEHRQHEILDLKGIPNFDNSLETIQPDLIPELLNDGWKIGSHSHDHSDLRIQNSNDLFNGLKEALDLTVKIGGMPWLAWPEGRWNMEMYQIAEKVGFEIQFGLLDEPHETPPDGMIMRKIWS